MASVGPPSSPEENDANAALDPERKKKNGPWLHAWSDPVANLHAFSNCVRLADLAGDGDDKLLVADLDRKLKVYKGTSLLSEHSLLDQPCAISAFYSDANVPRTPAVAVASGPFVFIYRNLRPYYKFTLPPLEIQSLELDVWSNLRLEKMAISQAISILTEARENGVLLSGRSLDLISLSDTESQREFVEHHRHLPLSQQTVVTCMETLQKDSEEPKSISCLVLGTENREVIILDPSGTSIAKRVEIPGVPAFIACQGTYDVEYRIVVACRNGNIYTVKNHKLLGGPIELETMPCGLVLVDKSLYVACMDNVIHSFHFKGKKNFTIYLPDHVLSMCLMEMKHSKSIKGVLVSLNNGEVRLYNGKHLISSIKNDDPVSALRFGPYAREENTLVMIHKRGALDIKILGRHANLDVSDVPPGPPPEQDIPLNIPKKTRLYVEQTEREREQSTQMHRVFQRELCKLRVATARSYVKIISDNQGPIANNSTALRLHVQSRGLGPFFKMLLSLKNTSVKALTEIPLVFSYNHEVYRLPYSMIKVPLLVPGIQYDLEVPVECIDPQGAADQIQIFVCNPRSVVPVISAILKMPVSEVLEQKS
eukprot:TRINITY_DN3175_c0_g1_i7.p1 TRINITY_DN3175_c0_g1~~TRINITY_DN3175_c0_g1_i7.p1  ORF type:complete len:595 (+),score=101.41 TRINITY_DN3175_c0_g1_i7:67-1851(+)